MDRAMPAAPIVSIVTPTKNRRALLSEAISSVQAQAFSDWEHIVIDDGSDDGTPDAITALGDPRVRLIRSKSEKRGANVCRNIGVREACGRYVIFLDSDDLLAPDCLARRVEVMERNADLDFATFQTSVFVNEPNDLSRSLDTNLLGDDLARFLYFELPWIITAPIWRRKTLLRLDMFDEALPSWQDVELHIRAITAGCRYLRFPEVDHHVRWQFEETKISVEQRRSPRHLAAADGIIEKFEQLVREGPGMDWVRQRALCSLYFFVAECWLGIGKTGEALACWRRVRERGLAPATLHGAGIMLLLLKGQRSPVRPLGERLAHKWKGWARLRTNPELVPR